jgi:hypothetical protein
MLGHCVSHRRYALFNHVLRGAEFTEEKNQLRQCFLVQILPVRHFPCGEGEQRRSR